MKGVIFLSFLATREIPIDQKRNFQAIKLARLHISVMQNKQWQEKFQQEIDIQFASMYSNLDANLRLNTLSFVDWEGFLFSFLSSSPFRRYE